MQIHSYHALVALALCTIYSNQVRAEDFERIRPEAPMLKTAVATALEGSPTFRSIVERMSSAGPDFRYVRVQILCDQSPQALVAIVAHELQHAAEIASARAVVDDNSFGRWYRKIGFPTCLSPETNQFETAAAVEAGRRVRAEVRQYSSSNTQAARQHAAPSGVAPGVY
jgi:hypothetical protein